jgi:hypothetical protein
MLTDSRDERRDAGIVRLPAGHYGPGRWPNEHKFSQKTPLAGPCVTCGFTACNGARLLVSQQELHKGTFPQCGSASDAVLVISTKLPVLVVPVVAKAMIKIV